MIKVVDLFGDLVVSHDDKRLPVQALEAAMEDVNFEAVSTVRLPCLFVYSNGAGYKIHAFASEQHCMNQIIEQVIMRFDASGVNDEVGQKLLSISNTRRYECLEAVFELTPDGI